MSINDDELVKLFGIDFAKTYYNNAPKSTNELITDPTILNNIKEYIKANLPQFAVNGGIINYSNTKNSIVLIKTPSQINKVQESKFIADNVNVSMRLGSQWITVTLPKSLLENLKTDKFYYIYGLLRVREAIYDGTKRIFYGITAKAIFDAEEVAKELSTKLSEMI